MPVCVYEGCVSGSKMKNKTKDPRVHLHRFPKNPEMRQRWARQIRRGCGEVPNINFETGIYLNFNIITYLISTTVSFSQVRI